MPTCSAQHCAHNTWPKVFIHAPLDTKQVVSNGMIGQSPTVWAFRSAGSQQDSCSSGSGVVPALLNGVGPGTLEQVQQWCPACSGPRL